VWCLDSFWHDEAGRKLKSKLLSMGESCFIIPKNLNSKDPNDLLKELDVDYISEEFVKENTYIGKLGLSKLTLMRMEDLTRGAF